MTTEHLSEDQLLASLDRARAIVEVGAVYSHYRDSQAKYRVMGIAIIEATQEPGVIYQKESGSLRGTTWIRPVRSWLELVETESGTVPRFQRVC